MERGKREFVIGVTGHRRLTRHKISSIWQAVSDFLNETADSYPGFTLTMLSSLAEGADMLCAKEALSCGLKLVVPLPMSVAEYRKDFDETGAAEFDRLLSEADDSFVVTPREPVPGDPPRGFYYRQAGIYVADCCDVLLAVWDNVERNTPDGAGTWETIKLAKRFGKRTHIISM